MAGDSNDCTGQSLGEGPRVLLGQIIITIIIIIFQWNGSAIVIVELIKHNQMKDQWSGQREREKY